MHYVRLTLHILAATIWVGGQFTLGALVPVLRQAAPAAVAPVARRFAVLAWWAYAALIVTGVWNVAAEANEMNHGDWVTLWVKLALVAISGTAAFIHQRINQRAMIVAFGAISAISAIL